MKIYRVSFGDIEECDFVTETEKGFRVTTGKGVRLVKKMAWKNKAYSRGFFGSKINNVEKSFKDLHEAKEYAIMQISEYEDYLTNEECILNAKRNKIYKTNL